MTTPIMNQYKNVKAQHKDYLLFFRLGDFYEMFYDDAIKAADILGITLTKRAQKNEDIPMSGIPFHTCEHYIAKLVKAGQKIAICEQVESAQAKTSAIIDRQVVRIITPGTLTDDTLLNAKRNNFLITLFGNGCNVSCAVFDLSTREFFTQEFEASGLKDFLEKMEPGEILMHQNWITRFPDYESWRDIITIIPEIEKHNAVQKILKFFDLYSAKSLEGFSVDELICIANIIEYIQLTQKQFIKNIKLPKKKIATTEMQIDKFTRRNLEITKTLQNNNTGSLLWLLDNTKTAQGGRALFKFITNPITDIESLNKRYANIEFFLSNLPRLNQIISELKGIPDFERIFTKLAMNRSNPYELRKLALGIQNLGKLCNMLEKNMPDNHELIGEILKAIIPETQPNSKEYFINSKFDNELDEWKQFEKKIDQEILNIQENYRKETKLANLRIKHHSNFGYLVEINNSYKDRLTYNYTLIQELKNAARYSTAQLDQINAKMMECADFINTREQQIFEHFVDKLMEIASDIENYATISAQIDLFANLAAFCYENKYTKPELTQDNSFIIKNGRHPILDKVLRNKGQTFVENDCNLCECVMFMTGPNMAGKSTYLRQQALIALLAHIGMFVPACFAKIGIIDHLFSRISTNDNLIEGTSTFMLEMIEIALTLNQATKKSFVVLDEVGRGTSSEEGIAIAQSILEYLLERLECRSIFATHYLALRKIQHSNLQQKMLEIIEDPIYFTHKVVPGVAKKSYALSVAKLAGMPNAIIERAESILSEKSN